MPCACVNRPLGAGGIDGFYEYLRFFLSFLNQLYFSTFAIYLNMLLYYYKYTYYISMIDK